MADRDEVEMPVLPPRPLVPFTELQLVGFEAIRAHRALIKARIAARRAASQLTETEPRET